MEDVKEKILKAKIQLQKSHPFWSYILHFLEIKEDDSIPTFGTDGQKMLYNHSFAMSLSLEETKFVICHEVGHCAFIHISDKRRGSRDKKKWNNAADFVTNGELINQGIGKMPQGGLHDHNFDNMSVEEVYDQLPNPIDNTFDFHIYGSDESESHDKKKEERGLGGNKGEKKKVDWGKICINGTILKRQQGWESNSITEEIESNMYPKLDWRDLLQRFVAKKVSSFYDWTRPNQNYIQHGIYIPSLRPDKFELLVGIDTSGSITKEELGQFLSEIKSIFYQWEKQLKLTLIVCDAEVHNTYEITNNFPDVELKGRGGTDFRPVFKWIEENKEERSILIFFSDGWGSYPDDSPPYETMWIMVKDYNEPPFGQVVPLY